jgi:hypothetical protein
MKQKPKERAAKGRAEDTQKMGKLMQSRPAQGIIKTKSAAKTKK